MVEKPMVIPFAALILALPLVAGAALEQAKQTRRITVPELKEKLDSGEKFLLIDVRENKEIKENGAIPGAIQIPIAELERRMEDIPRDIEVIFYCQGGGRASRVAEKFLKSGYKSSQFCGIRDWKKEGQKVIDKLDRPEEGSIQPKP